MATFSNKPKQQYPELDEQFRRGKKPGTPQAVGSTPQAAKPNPSGMPALATAKAPALNAGVMRREMGDDQDRLIRSKYLSRATHLSDAERSAALAIGDKRRLAKTVEDANRVIPENKGSDDYLASAAASRRGMAKNYFAASEEAARDYHKMNEQNRAKGVLFDPEADKAGLERISLLEAKALDANDERNDRGTAFRMASGAAFQNQHREKMRADAQAQLADINRVRDENATEIARLNQMREAAMQRELARSGDKYTPEEGLVNAKTGAVETESQIARDNAPVLREGLTRKNEGMGIENETQRGLMQPRIAGANAEVAGRTTETEIARNRSVSELDRAAFDRGMAEKMGGPSVRLANAEADKAEIARDVLRSQGNKAIKDAGGTPGGLEELPSIEEMQNTKDTVLQRFGIDSATATKDAETAVKNIVAYMGDENDDRRGSPAIGQVRGSSFAGSVDDIQKSIDTLRIIAEKVEGIMRYDPITAQIMAESIVGPNANKLPKVGASSGRYTATPDAVYPFMGAAARGNRGSRDAAAQSLNEIRAKFMAALAGPKPARSAALGPNPMGG